MTSPVTSRNHTEPRRARRGQIRLSQIYYIHSPPTLRAPSAFCLLLLPPLFFLFLLVPHVDGHSLSPSRLLLLLSSQGEALRKRWWWWRGWGWGWGWEWGTEAGEEVLGLPLPVAPKVEPHQPLSCFWLLRGRVGRVERERETPKDVRDKTRQDKTRQKSIPKLSYRAVVRTAAFFVCTIAARETP